MFEGLRAIESTNGERFNASKLLASLVEVMNVAMNAKIDITELMIISQATTDRFFFLGSCLLYLRLIFSFY